MVKKLGFLGLLAGHSQKVTSVEEIKEAAESGWAGTAHPSGHDAGESSFDERGEAAWQHYRHTGESVPADEVLAKLRAKLDAWRKRPR